ncbi:MAG: phosphoglucosamine mutase [Desulfobacterales bacterium]
MGKLFGTDGIRGVANQYPMTAEMALKVGRVLGHHFGNSGRSAILIGRDTRISGQMIESAIAAGCCSMGVDVVLAGVVPTPGVAFLTREMGAASGVVVSASHNPYFDNGIKVFDARGFKLSDKVENALETTLLDGDLAATAGMIREIGKINGLDTGGDQYEQFLTRCFPTDCRLDNLKIVLDCANGATSFLAPRLFSELGAEVCALYVEPDGKNINEGCGSQHPQNLAEKVRVTGADIGLAFDGDGDRLIAVDETGAVLTGDQVLAICARYLKKNGRLKNNVVVSTVMSNMGLGESLRKEGIKNVITGVGDRYVMEEMHQQGAVLGGEDSGHTVFLDHQTTGDGMLTALKLLEIIQSENRPLSELKKAMMVFPQVLINVDVNSKPPLVSLPNVTATICQVEKDLAGKGRVLVRYSGTQPQCRVMVEGPNADDTNLFCNKIAEAVKNLIGS